MPRLAPPLLRYARRKNPLLPILLRECRDTRSAENELRWLKEHALALWSPPSVRVRLNHRGNVSSVQGWRTTLRHLVRRRAKGEPLQYILGTQPFGDLEILCEEGVLIPRPETEAYTVNLAESILKLKREETAIKRQKLRILDLCTGTGCIALLLHSLLRPPSSKEVVIEDAPDNPFVSTRLEILGVDISKTALRLAKKNLHYNLKQRSLHLSARHDVSFATADILRSNASGNLSGESGTYFHEADQGSAIPSAWEMPQHEGLCREWDIVVSNPPYISPRHFAPGGNTMRSVRRWEPQLALVPKQLQPSPSQYTERTGHGKPLQRGDEFYPYLLELARSAGAKAVLLEVGDNEQAVRVRSLAVQYFAGESEVAVEVWRDDGSVNTATGDCDFNYLENGCRAVVIWRSSWAKWRMDRMNDQKQPI